MIKKYNNFLYESSYIDEFSILYNDAPSSLKLIIDECENAEQNPYWHPEGNTLNHIKLVVNRLHNCYNDINLDLAGLFHDLGKTITTEWDEEKKSWTAHGHEDEFAIIANKYKNWIESLGADFNTVEFIIKNHMRIKYLDEFRFQEKIKFINEPLFDYVLKFETADYGGTELTCQPIKDLSKIKKEINEYNKLQEENKIISSKFNGKIIMNLYPELNGKDLGKIINDFKQQFVDFRKYILETPKETILNKFKKFYENGKS